MPGREAAERVVAAADVAAGLAHPQVDPAPTGREALLAPLDGLGQLEDLYGVEVGAGGHASMVATRSSRERQRRRDAARGVHEPLQQRRLLAAVREQLG